MLNQKWEEHHEMIDAELHGGNFLLRTNCSRGVKAVNGNLGIVLVQSEVSFHREGSVPQFLYRCRNAGATVLELQFRFDGLP